MSSIITTITSKTLIGSRIAFGVHVITSCGAGLEIGAGISISSEYFYAPGDINGAIESAVLDFLSENHGITLKAGESFILMGGAT